MNQYLVTAYDYTDEDALKRRMNIRPQHLQNLKPLKDSGNYIIGGALLNSEGNMMGSALILQFDNDKALEAWKQSEPYITQKIWETVDIKPYRVAEI